MKLFLLIAFTLPSLTLASDCEVRKGYTVSHTICWSESIKGHVSKNCLTRKCDALTFKLGPPVATVMGSNRTVSACTRAGAGVIVLRDEKGNEDSFCEFDDGSLRSAASMESSP